MTDNVRSDNDRPGTIFELAHLLGRYRFIELALFGIVGECARQADDAALCVALSEASHAHAYRADLIERRLMVSFGLPGVTDSTRSPGPAHNDLLAKLADAGPNELICLLTSVWYPSMLDTYRVHLLNCADASDGPIRRMLGRIEFDLATSLAELSRHERNTTSRSEIESTTQVIDAVGGPFGTRRL